MSRLKKGPGNDKEGAGNVTVGGKQVLVSVQDKIRRQKHNKFFDELVMMIQETNKGTQALNSRGAHEVPTLAVGYIARAMGLNISNKQVVSVVEMVEEKDAISRGFVSAGPLKEVLVEALMTGIMSPPKSSLLSAAPAASSKKKNTSASANAGPKPFSVVRDSEGEIYEAFRVLDLARNGYLEADEIRRFLRSGGEPFTEDEVEEFIAAAADPEDGRIYYEEFADVLATE